MTTTLGYTIFYVADVRATVAFFHEAFELEPKFVTDEGDYGELATGTTTLAFAAIPLAMDGLSSGGGFTPSDPNQPPRGLPSPWSASSSKHFSRKRSPLGLPATSTRARNRGDKPLPMCVIPTAFSLS